MFRRSSFNTLWERSRAGFFACRTGSTGYLNRVPLVRGSLDSSDLSERLVGRRLRSFYTKTSENTLSSPGVEPQSVLLTNVYFVTLPFGGSAKIRAFWGGNFPPLIISPKLL